MYVFKRAHTTFTLLRFFVCMIYFIIKITLLRKKRRKVHKGLLTSQPSSGVLYRPISRNETNNIQSWGQQPHAKDGSVGR